MNPDLNVVVVPVVDLVPDPENARKHSPRNVDAIAGSLRLFGQRRPLVVHGQVVIAGNGTLEAAKSLGWSHVAITRTPAGWSVEQARAYALADNRTAELAEWDDRILADQLVELDAVGWDVSSLGFEALNPPTGDLEGLDDFDASPPSDPVTQRGDLWLLGEHRIICGDAANSTDYGTLLGTTLADCVWTDPPYGVAIVGGNHSLSPAERLKRGGKTIENDRMDVQALTAFLRNTLGQAFTATREGGAWYVAAPHGPMGLAFSVVLSDLNVWKHSLVWNKDSLVMGRADYHYKHEPIYYGWKPGASHLWMGDRKQTTVLDFKRPTRNAEHPTMKPVELIDYCLRNSTRKGDAVLDPFSGSGSTIMACVTNDRIGYGIELDPAYVDVICRRYQQGTGTLPIHAETGKPHDFLADRDG